MSSLPVSMMLAHSWVHGETSYMTRVSLERGDLLIRIVMEGTELEVVRASNNFVVVEVDGAVVQTCYRFRL
jgi:hypothetical protein